MKFLIIATTMLLAQACGRAPVIDPEFQSYVKSFEDAAEVTVWSDIEFSDELKPTSAGTCNHSSKAIKINRAEWQKWPTTYREQIMFHELGHCVLDRATHDESMKSDNNPRSIMHPSFGVIPKYWKTNRAAYLKELIDGRQDR